MRRVWLCFAINHHHQRKIHFAVRFFHLLLGHIYIFYRSLGSASRLASGTNYWGLNVCAMDTQRSAQGGKQIGIGASCALCDNGGNTALFPLTGSMVSCLDNGHALLTRSFFGFTTTGVSRSTLSSLLESFLVWRKQCTGC